MEIRPTLELTGFRECLTLWIVVSGAYDGEGPQKLRGCSPWQLRDQGSLGNWDIICSYLNTATIVVAVVCAVNVPDRRAVGRSKWGLWNRTRAVGNKENRDSYSNSLQMILSIT